MLHVINFFRQPAAEGADLYLNAHDRLLGAVHPGPGLQTAKAIFFQSTWDTFGEL